MKTTEKIGSVGKRFDEKIPFVEKEDYTNLQIPVIDLKSEEIHEMKFVMDSNLPKFEKLQISISIPKISLEIPRMEMIRQTFLSDIPKIEMERYEERIIIPKILIYSEETLTTSFVREFSMEIPIEIKYEPVVDIKETPANSKVIISEEEDYFKEFFGIESSRFYENKTFIIFYYETNGTISTFENICRRIYRERERGEPKFYLVSKLKTKEDITEVEKFIKPDGCIVRIDCDRILEDKKEEELEEIFEELIFRFVTGKTSFLIFLIRNRNIEKIVRKIIEEKVKHNYTILEIKPSLKIEPIKLSEALSGVSKDIIEEIRDKKIKEENKHYLDLDSIYNQIAQEIRKEMLGNLEKQEYSIIRNPSHGEESDLHAMLKLLIIKYIADKHNYENLKDMRENILVEREISPGVIPDVYDEKENEAYEIETLFSEGSEGGIQNKIYRTLERYENIGIKKVYIIFDTLTTFIHLKTLFSLERKLKDIFNFDIEFCTFKLLKRNRIELIPLTKYKEEIVNIIKSEEVNLS